MELSVSGLMRCFILLISGKLITSDFLRVPPLTSHVKNGPKLKVMKCADDREKTYLSSMDKNVHLPECMPDGNLYRKEQCNREIGYCWCVDQVEGVPIEGSVVRGSDPSQVKCQAAPEQTSQGMGWRSDERCGATFPFEGKPSICDPNGARPCCSSWGWCGSTDVHCKCEGCVDYKKVEREPESGDQKWRLDGRCGPDMPVNGRPGECDPLSNFPCCSKWGWCGIKKEHCECTECMDYRIAKELLSKASAPVPVENSAQTPGKTSIQTRRSRIRFGVPMNSANSFADRKTTP